MILAIRLSSCAGLRGHGPTSAVGRRSGRQGSMLAIFVVCSISWARWCVLVSARGHQRRVQSLTPAMAAERLAVEAEGESDQLEPADPAQIEEPSSPPTTASLRRFSADLPERIPMKTIYESDSTPLPTASPCRPSSPQDRVWMGWPHPHRHLGPRRQACPEAVRRHRAGHLAVHAGHHVRQ